MTEGAPDAVAAATSVPDAIETAGVSRDEAGLRIRGIRKWYGDTRALDGLDIDARPGEILGIAGPNGAGKSTLIKILAGEVAEDEGSIELDGAPWNKHVDTDRVAVVHQEPQLFPNLTVGENMLVGREGRTVLSPELSESDRLLMSDLAILDFSERPLAMVPLAIQQRTEIGRALARSARIFLFDEPNSALTQEESNDLFRRMRALAAAGRVVLLVSHRIAELARHADRVALILDGRTTQILEGEDLTQENIAAGLVVGQAARDLEAERFARAEEDAVTALRLTGWTHQGGEFSAVDLHVNAGEIVAIVGVEGSGARELVRSIAGFESASGVVELGDGVHNVDLASRTALVSPDRQASLFTNLSISENLVVRLDREIAVRGAALHQGRIRRIAHQLRDQFRIVAKSLEVPIRSLSGGNQQKVAIASAIVKRPEVLVLEEPTRGVDVGSKREIYRLMREYAGQGHALIIFCTEVPEVFDVADIGYVVSDGALSDPLLVMNYADVEALARAITRLERHPVATPDPGMVAAGAG
ncbi:MAG: ATP-binding cassette domain-containing protein [Chloroflexota bacterium]